MIPEDEEKVRNANAKNVAEALLYTIEQLINKDLSGKITDEQFSSIQKSMQELKSVLDLTWIQIEPKIIDLRNEIKLMAQDVYGDLIPPEKQERTA